MDRRTDLMDSLHNRADQRAHKTRRSKPQLDSESSRSSRHFVLHDYHDHSKDTIEDHVMFQSDTEVFKDTTEGNHGDSSAQASSVINNKKRKGPRGGVTVPFPTKLHVMLSKVEEDGFAHIVSWQPHGRCFVVHEPKEFVKKVMPVYFRQSKLTSFQRQLNLYGFARLTSGRDRGGYYHELFLRHKLFLCEKMTRIRIKGTGIKGKASPETEPDFYSMPPMVPDPHPLRSTVDLNKNLEEAIVAAMEESKIPSPKHASKSRVQRKDAASFDSLTDKDLEDSSYFSPKAEKPSFGKGKVASLPPALVTPVAQRPMTLISFPNSNGISPSFATGLPQTQADFFPTLDLNNNRVPNESISIRRQFVPPRNQSGIATFAPNLVDNSLGDDPQGSNHVSPDEYSQSTLPVKPDEKIMFEGQRFHYLDSFVMPGSEENLLHPVQTSSTMQWFPPPQPQLYESRPDPSLPISHTSSDVIAPLPHPVSNITSSEEAQDEIPFASPILTPSSSSSSIYGIISCTDDPLDIDPESIFDCKNADVGWSIDESAGTESDLQTLV